MGSFEKHKNRKKNPQKPHEKKTRSHDYHYNPPCQEEVQEVPEDSVRLVISLNNSHISQETKEGRLLTFKSQEESKNTPDKKTEVISREAQEARQEEVQEASEDKKLREDQDKIKQKPLPLHQPPSKMSVKTKFNDPISQEDKEGRLVEPKHQEGRKNQAYRKTEAASRREDEEAETSENKEDSKNQEHPRPGTNQTNNDKIPSKESSPSAITITSAINSAITPCRNPAKYQIFGTGMNRGEKKKS